MEMCIIEAQLTKVDEIYEIRATDRKTYLHSPIHTSAALRHRCNAVGMSMTSMTFKIKSPIRLVHAFTVGSSVSHMELHICLFDFNAILLL